VPNSPLISVRDLSKNFRSAHRREGLWGGIVNLFHREYRTVEAVSKISFEIEPGEMVGYIGPNGAGKSTTIKMLTGILVPSSGEMVSNGFVPWRERTAYVRTIGVVFGQRTQLWWDIAVIESLKLLRRIYDVSQRDFDERIETFDQILGLRDYLNTPVRKLSLGERMLCDLAAALLHNRTTVLLTTHDLDDIEELCRRIMIIDHGRLLYDGPLALLKQKLLRTKQVKFALRDKEQLPQLAAIEREGLKLERVDELTWRISFDRTRVSTADLIRQILGTVEIRDLLIEDEPIEELIKRIYAGEALHEVNS